MKFESNKAYIYIIMLGIILVVLFVFDGFFGVDFIVNTGNAPLEITSKAAQADQQPKSDEGRRAHEQEETSGESLAAQEELPNTSVSASFEDRLQSYQDSLLATLAPGERRQDMVIRYYPHVPDGELIYKLKDLGFYVHQRPPTEGLGNLPTNSLFYGDDIDVRDIQVVAKFLMEQGIEIRQIVPSRFHADWKADAIEIGTSVEAQRREPITLQGLEAFQKVLEP